jgi:hypothetical protein
MDLRNKPSWLLVVSFTLALFGGMEAKAASCESLKGLFAGKDNDHFGAVRGRR